MLNKIFFPVLFIFTSVYSQSILIQPSTFFTYGNYSDKTISRQYSFFLGGSIGQSNFLVAGYDIIQLKNELWRYEQTNLALGIHYWITDWRLKLKTDFLLIKGKYTDDFNNKRLIDNGFLISPEMVYGVYPLHYGLGASYFLENGNYKTNSSQLYLRMDYYPHYKFLITLIPSFHLISDNSKYLSFQTMLTYFPFYELSINSTFTIGARKFYYNPDLMVLFNQLETQLSNYSFRINYNFYKNLVASLIYQKSKFSSYKIDYFVIGIRSSIYF